MSQDTQKISNYFLEKVCIILFGGQIVLLLLFIFSYQLTKGNPVLLWDQAGYYQDAIKFYQTFSLEGLRLVNRPLFSLPSLILLRGLAIPLNPVILIVCNALIYQAILVGSTVWIVQLLKVSRVAGITVLSILWATSPFYELSSDLWGDIPQTAWVFFYTALLIYTRISNFSILGTLGLGIVGAIGLQIKPIFIFYGIISTTVFCFMGLPDIAHKIQNRSFLLKLLSNILILGISFSTIVNLIYPRNLFNLIQDLTYNNEVLGYWQGQKGIFNTWLWFVNALGKNFSIPIVLITLNNTIGLGILSLKRWVGRYGEKIVENPVITHSWISLNLTFGLAWIYISFFVKSKDIRTTFFLFALFILISILNGERLIKSLQLKSNLFVVGCTIVIGLNLLFMLSWTVPNPLISWINQRYHLKENNLITNKPLIQAADTYENLGIAEAVQFLERQPTTTTHKVFISHNSWRYNDALFISYYYARAKVLPKSPNPQINFTISSAPFNLGGWGNDGGIPVAFFTSDFVINVPEHTFGAFDNPTIEVYNFKIAEALRQQNPAFLDGLEKQYERKNHVNETIVIYRRKHLPSAQNFATIVNELANADKNNLFNIPFIDRALQIHPELKELQSQLITMKKPEFLSTVTYRFNNPTKQEEIKKLLRSYSAATSSNVNNR